MRVIQWIRRFLKKAKYLFHKCKFWILWNSFIAKIVLISLKYLFWSKPKCRQIKLSALGWNRGLLSNIRWLRSTNRVKITVECVRRSILYSKMLTNGRNRVWLLQVLDKKTIDWVETIWLSDKEKVSDWTVSKEVDADSLPRNKRVHLYWFPWKKNATIKRASYCQLLRQYFTLFF